MAGNGVRSPTKAAGSESVGEGERWGAGRGPLLICHAWISRCRHASSPSERSPGLCSCCLPRRKGLSEFLKLASVGTAPVEKGNLLYCLLSWWHFAHSCWSHLEIWLFFRGLVFRSAFQCAHCIPAPAGNCVQCAAPVHLMPLSFGDSFSNAHAAFLMLGDLPAGVSLRPAARVALQHGSDLHRLLFLQVTCFKAWVITGRNPSLQRGFRRALFLVSYLSAFFSCLCLRKN